MATFKHISSKNADYGAAEQYLTFEHNDSIEEFDGISLIEWTEENKIKFLKEFGCNLNNYNPYQNSDIPKFKNEQANWF